MDSPTMPAKNQSLLGALRAWLKERKKLKKQQRRQQEEIQQWQSRGCPAPPPHPIKQQALRQHAERYGLKILVETGTFKGDMVEAMRPVFEKLYSIELSVDFFTAACQRFRGVEKVELINGDSGRELGRLMPRIDRPTLFWLDGHYSGGDTARGETDTPIYAELDAILSEKDLGHVIIIDDARLFGSDPTYPTLEQLSAFVAARRSGLHIAVEHDSIRITPHGR